MLVDPAQRRYARPKMTGPVRIELDAAAAATDGQLIAAADGRLPVITSVSVDTRSLQAGQTFVAIHGPRFDGHDYCEQAADQGAVLLVVHRDVPADLQSRVPLLRVEDTTVALADLACHWRQHVAPKVVGITGSLGKTTTKELTRQMLQRLGPTHCNRANLNNHIGLPLTLLSMPEQTRYLVTEMGMSGPGEIAALAQTAQPDIGAITSIAPVHLEFLGSVEAIAAAKAELWVALGPAGLAVAPADEPLLRPHLAGVGPHRQLLFGEGCDDCAVCIDEIEALGPRGSRVTLKLQQRRHSFVLPLVGRHNARNAAAAAAIGLALDVPHDAMVEALSLPPALEHRSSISAIGSWQVFDDCYNASPMANQAALQTLQQLGGAHGTIAVLGAMLELGERSAALHRELGQYAATLGLQRLITVGSDAEAIAVGARDAGMPPHTVHAVDDAAAAAAIIEQRAAAGCWILVKGSRGARMEAVIEALRR